MVFLGPPTAEIEIRLVKPPFDALESARVYFDEYEKLGTPHPEKLTCECTRYIVPENTAYAVEITLKKGFDCGKWDGIYLQVCNNVSGAIIGGKRYPKPKEQTGSLPIGKKILVDKIDCAVVDGKITDHATLTFRALSIGTYG
jgi:hypothetical protein